MKLTLEVDQDLTDKIFKQELEDLIDMVQGNLDELYSKETLRPYQVADLVYDEKILKALIEVYNYISIDNYD